MKARQSGSGGKRQAAFILETLAAKIPDHILEEYFGDVPPGRVSNYLHDQVKVGDSGTSVAPSGGLTSETVAAASNTSRPMV